RIRAAAALAAGPPRGPAGRATGEGPLDHAAPPGHAGRPRAEPPVPRAPGDGRSPRVHVAALHARRDGPRSVVDASGPARPGSPPAAPADQEVPRLPAGVTVGPPGLAVTSRFGGGRPPLQG